MGPQDKAVLLTAPSNSPRPSTSQAIAEGAENRLRCNSYLALKNVRCECHEGVLVLRGCLPTYYLKQMAQTAVAAIEGVRQIVNEIDVVALPSTSPPRVSVSAR
jgi:osmotically-inducible protein OsmY